mgnify:CR=1 FL=1
MHGNSILGSHGRRTRFHRDSVVGSHLFYLVPTLIINHSDLQDLVKCLLFWERDLPSASSLLSELKQWNVFEN